MIYVLTALVVALGAAAQAASGFGFALLAVPLLALLLGAKTAVVTIALAATAFQVVITIQANSAIRRRSIAVMTAGAFAGMPFGLLILDRIDERALTVAIAVGVLGFTLALVRRVRVPAGATTDAIAGFVSGMLTTTTGTSGPPLVIALHAHELSPDGFRATIAAQFLVQGSISVIAFAFAGRITGEVGLLALAALPGLGLGWLVGQRIFSRLDPARFRRVVIAMLALSALASLVGVLLG